MQAPATSYGSERATNANTAASLKRLIHSLFHLNHIVARIHGGNDDPSNLCWSTVTEVLIVLRQLRTNA